MKAWQLIKNGKIENAFKLAEIEKPNPKPDEILIKVEAFGLNYADVMASQGLYPDAPKKPCVLGYDVVGIVEQKGDKVKNFEVGDRVSSMTIFGGYAEYAVAREVGAIKIKKEYDATECLAFSTQYCTAIIAAENLANIQSGENVLIHAAAGGVGTALIQIAKNKGCKIFGTAGTDEKLEYIRNQGVEFPINYRKVNWAEELATEKNNRFLDTIFDPVCGISVANGFKTLRHGGKIVVYGGSSFSSAKNIFQKIRTLRAFGKYHPLKMMASSKSILTLNMLSLGKAKPELLQQAAQKVLAGYETGYLKPTVAKNFDAKELPQALQYLADRKTMGKIGVYW